jgi:tripartite-type tricarboxylate transporter receptor subunit TctC
MAGTDIRGKAFTLAMTLTLLFAGAGVATSQTWPARPVRLIVPQSPGGSTDQVARPLARLLSEALGQPVAVENRPGAGSVIGTDVVAKSAPDGYTLLAVAASFAISPSLYKKLPFDPVRDFAPVSLLASFPNVLVVPPSLPVASVKELIAYARANPGKLNYGSSGIGSGTHLSMELFRHMAGIDMVHVAYKGGAPAVNALLAGEVQVNLATISTALPQIKAGRLRALAVSGRAPLAALPGVPTIAESGLPGYEYDSWVGVLVPAGTPRAIVAKLRAELSKAAHAPEIKAMLALEGAEPVGNSSDEFAAIIRADLGRWKKLVDATGIKAE